MIVRLCYQCMRLAKGVWGGCALLLVCAFAFSSVVSAQVSRIATQPQTAFISLWDQIFENPGDMRALIRLVNSANRIGAYDQAISALEMYIINFPQDAKARIELAVLYHRIGSPQLAKRHADLAKELGTANQRDLQRLAVHEVPINRHANQGIEHKGIARAQLGYVYNPSGISHDDLVYDNGVLVQNTKKPQPALEGLVTLTNELFINNDRTRWDDQFLLRLNMNAYGYGPSFKTAQSGTIRLDFGWQSTFGTSSGQPYEVGVRAFGDVMDLSGPINEEITGGGVIFTGAWLPDPEITYDGSLTLAAHHNETTSEEINSLQIAVSRTDRWYEDFQTTQELGGSLFNSSDHSFNSGGTIWHTGSAKFRHFFHPPSQEAGRGLLTAQLKTSYRHDNGPDPSLDPSRTARDVDLDFTLEEEVSLGKGLAAFIGANAHQRFSTISNRRYENVRFYGGLTWRY